jgi:hypothetical protein
MYISVSSYIHKHFEGLYKNATARSTAHKTVILGYTLFWIAYHESFNINSRQLASRPLVLIICCWSVLHVYMYYQLFIFRFILMLFLLLIRDLADLTLSAGQHTPLMITKMKNSVLRKTLKSSQLIYIVRLRTVSQPCRVNIIQNLHPPSLPTHVTHSSRKPEQRG